MNFSLYDFFIFVKRCTKLHLLREIKGVNLYKNEKKCINLFVLALIEDYFGGFESAGHDVPVTIVGDFASFEVGYIGIFELTPDDTASVHLGKVVRGDGGDFDTEGVLTGTEVGRDVYLKGCCKDYAGIVTVDIEVCGLAHVAQAKDDMGRMANGRTAKGNGSLVRCRSYCIFP